MAKPSLLTHRFSEKGLEPLLFDKYFSNNKERYFDISEDFVNYYKLYEKVQTKRLVYKDRIARHISLILHRLPCYHLALLISMLEKIKLPILMGVFSSTVVFFMKAVDLILLFIK